MLDDREVLLEKSADIGEHGLERQLKSERGEHVPQLVGAGPPELDVAGVPLPMLMRQLGHANLQVTTIYLQGINVDEVLDVSRTMAAPLMPLPQLIAA